MHVYKTVFFFFLLMVYVYFNLEIYLEILKCDGLWVEKKEMERTTKRCAELGLVSNKEETSNIMFSTSLGSFLSDPLLFCCLICISHFHDFIYLRLQTMHPHFTLPYALHPYVRLQIHTLYHIHITFSICMCICVITYNICEKDDSNAKNTTHIDLV